MKDERTRVFPDAHQDIETSRGTPDTDQTRSPAYRLAFADDEVPCPSALWSRQHGNLRQKQRQKRYGAENDERPGNERRLHAQTTSTNPSPIASRPMTMK